MISKIIMKEQSKLTFNGIHTSNENCDSYTFKQSELLMDNPIYVGFAILEVSKLHKYETWYCKLQPYFTQEKLQCPNIDTDSFGLSMKTETIIKDLKISKDIFEFNN